MPKVVVTVRAYNADGYHKDILCMSEEQVHMSTSKIGNGWEGPAIDPKDFPEMVRFEIIVKEVRR